MKKIILFVFVVNAVVASAQTLQEKLGYSKDTKLLIVHADDLGVSHSEDTASIYALEKGSVSSASIMVPCPWFPEIAAYASQHSKDDFGLHLTFTSEWKYLKWPPVTSKENVPGIVNKNGFMFESVDSVYNSASLSEIDKEIRAQIERARQFGIDITHLDSHMGTLLTKKEYLEILIKIGREYKLPVMLSKQLLPLLTDGFVTKDDVVIDSIFVENPPDFKQGAANFYTHIIQSLQPGVSLIILHAAYDNEEMKAVTINHPDYGAAWRQADFNFFTSDVCKKLLQQNNIHVITWREIRDKLLRN